LRGRPRLVDVKRLTHSGHEAPLFVAMHAAALGTCYSWTVIPGLGVSGLEQPLGSALQGNPPCAPITPAPMANPNRVRAIA